LEQIQFAFLRGFLHLPHSTPLGPLLWEVGRLPLLPFALRTTAKYLRSVCQSTDYRFSLFHQTLRTGDFINCDVKLQHACKTSWIVLLSSIFSKSASCSLQNGDVCLGSKFEAQILGSDFPVNLFQSSASLCLTSIERSFTSPDEIGTIHRYYRSFYAPFGSNDYLYNHRSTSLRNLLCRLRLGVLPLDNTVQRWKGVAKNSRSTCPFCHADSVEDEAHFLLDCELNTHIRNQFSGLFSFGRTYSRNRTAKEDREKRLSILLSSTQHNWHIFSRFVFLAYRSRLGQHALPSFAHRA
jgi:hypothetical protein